MGTLSPMSLMMHLVRHGETQASRDHVFCGHADCQLLESGRRMAQLIAARCAASDSWRAVYSSPQTRAIETARPVAAALGLEITVEDCLREIDHGAWEGRAAADVRDEDPDFFDEWEQHAGSIGPPGGESGFQVAGRAMPVVERIRRRHPDGNVLVVSHKATIRIIVCALIGVDIDSYRTRVAAPVGSFTTIEFGQHGPLLHRLADVSHLPPDLRAPGGV
jgi:broad specificity phosphatase PhoE